MSRRRDRHLALAFACLASGCSALTGFGDLVFDETPDVPDSAAMDANPAGDTGGPDLGAPRDAGRDARPLGDGGLRETGLTDSGPIDPGAGGCDPEARGAEMITEIGREAGTGDRPGVIAYRVQYTIDGLRLFGQICVPMTPGPHAAVVYNHDGANGLMGQWGVDGGFLGLVPNICTYVARRNAVAIMPQFRGQTDDVASGGGLIEYCLGEVDDAETLAQIAMDRCDVDPLRVTAVGYDHGGCVTLQMIHRTTMTLAAAAVIAAPTDLTALHTYYSSAGRMAELAELEAWIGSPATAPDAYTLRSPLHWAAEIAARNVPLMVVHGTLDDVVPIQQSCDLRTAFGGVAFTNFHVDTLGNAINAPIRECRGDMATYVVPWPPPSPTRFSGPDYFLAFDQGHEFDPFRGLQAAEAYVDFVLAHVGPLD